MLNTKKTLTKVLANMKSPIKVVRYGWVSSPSATAGSRLIQSASPSNSQNPSDKPSGYTFKAWLMFTTSGWVGYVYPALPTTETTDIWTTSAKGSTTGVSIYGAALYIRNDLA